ncbi:MAG: alpha/beta hydrolase [Pseudonocardiales bacterium]|nr:MAG: alpha/beta hydrolase [Pseudonocardiales bacterium]
MTRHSTEQVHEPAPWSFAEPWGGTGHVTDLDGPVHWVDFGGPAGGTPIVLVHGLGGSHLNWVRVASALAERGRVLALDLPGFGLTTAGRRAVTVQANAVLLDRFVREIAGAPAVLIGNSMGGMVSLIEADAHPDSVAGLVLIDPSLPVPRQLPDMQIASQFLIYAVPYFGERYMAFSRGRMTDRQLVHRVIDLCFADPSKASGELVDAATALAGHRRTMPPQEAQFLQAARSLMFVLARPQRYQALMRRIDRPVLLVHGDRDRLVPVSAAHAALAANPRWEGAILAGTGHTPQLESPQAVLEKVTPWLERHRLVLPPSGPDS